jgi:hypothetical protein
MSPSAAAPFTPTGGPALMEPTGFKIVRDLLSITAPTWTFNMLASRIVQDHHPPRARTDEPFRSVRDLAVPLMAAHVRLASPEGCPPWWLAESLPVSEAGPTGFACGEPFVSSVVSAAQPRSARQRNSLTFCHARLRNQLRC